MCSSIVMFLLDGGGVGIVVQVCLYLGGDKLAINVITT